MCSADIVSLCKDKNWLSRNDIFPLCQERDSVLLPIIYDNKHKNFKKQIPFNEFAILRVILDSIKIYEIKYGNSISFDNSGNAKVRIYAFNKMSAKSALRPPTHNSYESTSWWNKYTAPYINRIFKDGFWGSKIMESKEQTIIWDVIINKR